MQQVSDCKLGGWEDDLVAIAERHDEDAFARLFRHFAPRVKAYAMRGGAEPAAAEEIAQDTMVTAWHKAELYDPSKAAVSTWLFTIARNLRIDRLRREKRPEPGCEDLALAPHGEGQPDAALRQIENAAALRQAINQLPKVQRDVVMLSFYEDQPHSAIACKLGLPLGTVKSRIRLALKKIGESLDAEAYGEFQ
ncbi:MAG: sigma-70 family RNA polymerase sigma factor [Alphaproteobacteria bacterium]|nr:sigma-70 family RNA polymerase sigma factor [Alphaproteobacteria bacterium]MCB9930235.1 sigma-70 family RNA polymerase sigma factor [Alphaproteobacteria bacterium]